MTDKNNDEISPGFGIICPRDGKIALTYRQYDEAMNRPNELWMCPVCGQVSDWDDDKYEAMLEKEEAEFERRQRESE